MRIRKTALGLAMALALTGAIYPSTSYTENRDAVQLAKTIYALGRSESYETKLALGTVVMNRVENAWFGNTLDDVLTEQQQFPSGER